jgi:hypothetical protein
MNRPNKMKKTRFEKNELINASGKRKHEAIQRIIIESLDSLAWRIQTSH